MRRGPDRTAPGCRRRRELLRKQDLHPYSLGRVNGAHVMTPAQVALVPDRFAQVISNLLGNAVKHTRGGVIGVRLWVEETNARLSIEDDGRGMSAEFIKNKAVSKGIITSDAAARLSDREALDLIFASGFSKLTVPPLSGPSSLASPRISSFSLPLRVSFWLKRYLSPSFASQVTKFDEIETSDDSA